MVKASLQAPENTVLQRHNRILRRITLPPAMRALFRTKGEPLPFSGRCPVLSKDLAIFSVGIGAVIAYT